MTLLAVRGVTKAFPGVQALAGVDLDVGAGEIHALVGENGAGKSTLIKILGGAQRPDRGTVHVQGAPLPYGDPIASARCGVQIIYQELTLVDELSAAENIFLGRERGRWWLARGTMRAAAQRLLDELGADVEAGARAGSLTVAQRQQVEIARALATDSRVLVLDEPTSALPGPECERLLTVLRGLRARGMGIIYISHRLDEVFALADRVTVLRDGRVAGQAPLAAVDRRTLIRWMVGRELEEEFPPRTPRPGSTVLEVRNLRAPGRLQDVELDLRGGEIVALAGLVGAGRSSTGLALYGAIPATGWLRLNGAPYAPRTPVEALRAGLAYLTEDRKAAGIFPDLGAGANLTITSLSAGTRAGWLSSAWEEQTARAAATRFDVRCAGLAQPAGTLSGGNQQKLLLARMLIEPRRVLILDEPTRGIDVGARAEIYRLLNRLTDTGLAILLISSDLPEVLGMSDRVIVLRDGCTVGHVARSDATQQRILELATGAAA